MKTKHAYAFRRLHSARLVEGWSRARRFSGAGGRDGALCHVTVLLPFRRGPKQRLFVFFSTCTLHVFCTGDEVAIPMQYSTVLALVIRVAIAVATCTFFQPDEYFQALEPAHYLVFGYGDLTWEWTSKPPIRTILYPALNIPVYWLLKIFRLDGTSLLVR